MPSTLPLRDRSNVVSGSAFWPWSRAYRPKIRHAFSNAALLSWNRYSMPPWSLTLNEATPRRRLVVELMQHAYPALVIHDPARVEQGDAGDFTQRFSGLKNCLVGKLPLQRRHPCLNLRISGPPACCLMHGGSLPMSCLGVAFAQRFGLTHARGQMAREGFALRVYAHDSSRSSKGAAVRWSVTITMRASAT